MKILRNELKNELHIITQKDFQQEGIEFIDIMPLIIQKDTFKEIVDGLDLCLLEKQENYHQQQLKKIFL